MTRFSLANPIAILMACLAILIAALVVTPRLSVDTFPELTPPVLVIGTQAPGMGPKDVEKTLTWRLEKFVSATPGVDHVQSVSRSGLSVIYVWLKWGTDLGSAQALVQQQVAFAMSSVPKSLGVVPPFVLQYDPSNAPVVQIAVYGGGLSGPQLYDYAVNVVEPVIEGIAGVASASPNGGRERQINVVVDPLRAAARGVTASEVSNAVAQANALLPSGRLLAPELDANVYTNAVPARVDEIGRATIKVVDGVPVYIADVATIEDGGSPNTQYVSVSGEAAVYLNVLRVPGGNVLDIVSRVKEAIAAQKNLPPGLKVEPIFDQSTFVRSTYHGLQKEIVQALFLVAVVILFFLQSPRAVLIACFSVPISFAVILVVLSLTGQTLNAFTLGGLTLAMGPLVDISVVVLESIHRKRHAGMNREEAAEAGATEMAVPALSATLATVAVLLPVALLAGLAKKLFVPLAITVATAMFAGYFVSMLVAPLACRYLLPAELSHGSGLFERLGRKAEELVHGFAERYARTLAIALGHRFWLLGAGAALIASSVAVAVQLPMVFFPEIDEGMERVYVRFAPGTSLASASAQLDAMAKLVERELPKGAATLTLVNVGAPGKARSAMNSPNSGPHMGFLRIALADAEHRRESQREIADQTRAILARAYPGVDFLQWPGGLVASVFSNGYLAPLVVEIRGDDLGELDRQAKAVAAVARDVAGIRDVFTSLELDYPELRVETDRAAASLLGVSPRMVAQTTLEATLGNINAPAVWVDGGNGQSYFVVTRYDERAVTDRASLGQMPVRADVEGGAVPLGSYGTIERRTGPIAIERNALGRVALVMMQTEQRDLGSAADELEARLRRDPRTKDFTTRFVGQVDLMRTTFGGLALAVGLAVFIVYAIMAIQFRSLTLPFAMLLAIPASLSGIVAALSMARQGFSITALMGVLMVIGIAASNGILLVDHAARSVRQGEDPLRAIVEAGRVRVTPILMTSLATIIGLLPTALGLERAAEANRPLALAVCGGLASSTVLSLFLVPALFVLLVRQGPARSLIESTGLPGLEPDR